MSQDPGVHLYIPKVKTETCEADDAELTTSVETKSGSCGVNRHRNGADGGDRLLQSLLISLRQEAVPGAVGGTVHGVVAALLRLKYGEKLRI